MKRFISGFAFTAYRWFTGGVAAAELGGISQ